MPLLSVSHLSVEYRVPHGGLPAGAATNGYLRVVDDVSFALEPGEILGLLGETGAGKTVACRAIFRLLPGHHGRIASGRIDFSGRDIARLPEAELRAYRGRQIAMVFQDGRAHLDPIMRIGEQIAETVQFHEGINHAQARRRAAELLVRAGTEDPQPQLEAFPHELGPAGLQRAMLALALACSPKLLIVDEPTRGVDIGQQARMLRLLLDLRDRQGMAVILVTSDLGAVAQACDSVAVMYAGRIVERATKTELLNEPLHPYSEGLIRSRPDGILPGETLRPIEGPPPEPSDIVRGCRYHPRCPHAQDACRFGDTQLIEISSWRATSCRRWQDLGS
jgi:peptide/nickel transport system ATP-binding protein